MNDAEWCGTGGLRSRANAERLGFDRYTAVNPTYSLDDLHPIDAPDELPTGSHRRDDAMIPHDLVERFPATQRDTHIAREAAIEASWQEFLASVNEKVSNG